MKNDIEIDSKINKYLVYINYKLYVDIIQLRYTFTNIYICNFIIINW